MSDKKQVNDETLESVNGGVFQVKINQNNDEIENGTFLEKACSNTKPIKIDSPKKIK